MVRSLRQSPTLLLVYGALLIYSFISLYPVFLILINSFKNRQELFASPYNFPIPLDFEGYQTVFERADFAVFFTNSIIITLCSIVFVLLLGAMLSFALLQYRFLGNRMLFFYFIIAIIIPNRLGTVSMINIMSFFNLQGTIWALVAVYTAYGIPIALYIMTPFLEAIPRDLLDAARIDGATDYRILFQLVLPLLRPAMVSVAVFIMLPIWNDLWFPLVLANEQSSRTITLGVSMFVGQFSTNWSALLASLSLALVPILILYVFLSRQLLAGLSDGAVK